MAGDDLYQDMYYGPFRGIVSSVNDPEKMGRVEAIVPSIAGNEFVFDWALPKGLLGSGTKDTGGGWFPEEGDNVWIEFEGGDARYPVWSPGFWAKPRGAASDVPKEARDNVPTNRVLKSKSGHLLEFDDKLGAEEIRITHKKGHTIRFATNGDIFIEDTNGSKIEMLSTGIVIDSGSNKTIVKASELNIGVSALKKLIKGEDLLTFLNTVWVKLEAHVHQVTGIGAPTLSMSTSTPPTLIGTTPTTVLTDKAKTE